MLKKNEIYRAVVTGFTSEGLGVCRVEGCAVFVPNAAPDEEYDLRIVHRITRQHPVRQGVRQVPLETQIAASQVEHTQRLLLSCTRFHNLEQAYPTLPR